MRPVPARGLSTEEFLRTARQWLEQFSPEDRALATEVVNRMRFLPFKLQPLPAPCWSNQMVQQHLPHMDADTIGCPLCRDVYGWPDRLD